MVTATNATLPITLGQRRLACPPWRAPCRAARSPGAMSQSPAAVPCVRAFSVPLVPAGAGARWPGGRPTPSARRSPGRRGRRARSAALPTHARRVAVVPRSPARSSLSARVVARPVARPVARLAGALTCGGRPPWPALFSLRATCQPPGLFCLAGFPRWPTPILPVYSGPRYQCPHHREYPGTRTANACGSQAHRHGPLVGGCEA